VTGQQPDEYGNTEDNFINCCFPTVAVMGQGIVWHTEVRVVVH